MINKKPLEKFIYDARKVHGYKYDYSQVTYVNNHTKVCIKCPKHGEFYQIPKNHIKGQGCPNCKRENLRITKSKSKEDFIIEANKIHNEKYDYSKTEYVNNHTKVCIICPNHGEFYQLPRVHLNGCGCPKCSRNQKFTKESFSEIGNLIHGNKYNYSKVNYINANTTVCIICPVHGEFWQTPHNHTHSKNPQGCPLCRQSKMERELKNHFKLKNIIFEEQRRFNWLGRQSFDFYLPEYRTAVECQGIQHFKEIEYFGGKNGFDERIKRDSTKIRLCKDNNINLFYYANYQYYFPYKVYTNKEELIEAIKRLKVI